MLSLLESRHLLLHLRASLRLKSKENILSRKVMKGFTTGFQNDSTFRESLLSIDRTEEVCIQMDKDAQKDFTYRMSQDEFFRFQKHWWISLNTSGINWTDERSFRLQRCVDHIKPSSPRIWRKDNSGRFHSGNTSNGTHHRVLPPAGGNGTVPGGAHDN